jgi:YD repeat-containing protein
MKKILSLLLILSTLFALAACNKQKAENHGEKNPTTGENGETEKPTEKEESSEELDYQNALKLLEERKYGEAYDAFKKLGDYKDSAERLTKFRKMAVNGVWDGASINVTFDEKNIPTKSVITSEEEGTYTVEVSYDEEFRVTKTHMTNDKLKLDIINEQKYDKNGNIIYESQYSDNNGNVYTSSTERTYNEDGKLLSEKSNDEGNIHITDFFYDENGYLVKSTNSDEDGVYSITEYENDDRGRKIKAVSHRDNSNVIYTQHFTYDENGNMLSSTTEIGTTVQRYEFEYDKNGNITRQAIYYNGDKINEVYCVYDEGGLLLSYTNTSGGNYTFEYVYELIYIDCDITDKELFEITNRLIWQQI